MTVRAINTPQYEYTCDLCKTSERNAEWIPPNWEGISIALYGGGMAQLHICPECITQNSIAFLFNKVRTSEPQTASHTDRSNSSNVSDLSMDN